MGEMKKKKDRMGKSVEEGRGGRREISPPTSASKQKIKAKEHMCCRSTRKGANKKDLIREILTLCSVDKKEKKKYEEEDIEEDEEDEDEDKESEGEEPQKTKKRTKKPMKGRKDEKRNRICLKRLEKNLALTHEYIVLLFRTHCSRCRSLVMLFGCTSPFVSSYYLYLPPLPIPFPSYRV